ncbi:MAG: tRNA (guanosine(46)-N7)-methyltransferase TrmB [Rhodospirillales bacterium]|nr:tRNA (guanosine(46)-N7)-methyltransferase TrmB [Rhodospirillales bacterium]
MTAEPAEPLRWFGRRHGRPLRPGRARLIEAVLPALTLDLLAAGRLDPASLFAGRDVWLEIGFGAGEHLAAQAKANPDIGFIGCEPFVNGVASLLAAVERDGLANLRLFTDDARLLLPLLPEASIARVFVLFSDPWPKARHWKRRFIQIPVLDELARVMRDGAEFRFASDHKGYVNWTLEHALGHPAFSWMAEGPKDWRERPADAIATRYETKALRQAVSCVYLRFTRQARPGPSRSP